MIAQKIKEVRELVSEIINDVSEYDELIYDQKKAQLSETSKLIAKFQLKSIPVPNELTGLKLNLIKEIDNLSNLKRHKTDLVSYLEDVVKGLATNERSKINDPVAENYYLRRKTLKIDTRVLKFIEENAKYFPMEICCKSRLQNYYATINVDGTFSTVVNNETLTLTTLNQLTVMITGSQRDGWSLWKTKIDDRYIFLKDLIKNNEV